MKRSRRRSRPSAPSRSPLRSGDGPFGLLGALAIQEVEVAPGLIHVEVYTRGGLLTLLWHGDRTEDRYVLMGGGAMGGLLGPADGAFHDIGNAAAARRVGAVRVGYRQPNNLSECILDMAAAADLASRAGADRFITVGHSFGGAVAVGGALMIPGVVGVATLATQSAGCEQAGELEGVPMLLIHGDRDEILPAVCSETVHALAGGRGELVVLPGAGHLLRENGAREAVRRLLLEWIGRTLCDSDGSSSPHPTRAAGGSAI